MIYVMKVQVTLMVAFRLFFGLKRKDKQYILLVYFYSNIMIVADVQGLP